MFIVLAEKFRFESFCHNICTKVHFLTIHMGTLVLWTFKLLLSAATKLQFRNNKKKYIVPSLFIIKWFNIYGYQVVTSLNINNKRWVRNKWSESKYQYRTTRKIVCFASGSCAFESLEEGVSERERESERLQQMINKPNERRKKKSKTRIKWTTSCANDEIYCFRMKRQLITYFKPTLRVSK